jgi:DNA repair exonuclease SbcCD ATPase subunit
MASISLKDLVENIRSAIKNSKASLDENKQKRKELIKLLRKSKEGVRAREALCSHITQSGLDASLVRDDLKSHRAQLVEVRKQLLFADVYRSVELSKFRTLHAQLDKLHEPFDPVAKARAAYKEKSHV